MKSRHYHDKGKQKAATAKYFLGCQVAKHINRAGRKMQRTLPLVD
ncbi:Uncharacterised protein [Vibrio cholerae]|nr:Uncharacterised protein [Vibrio cholerae]